MRRPWAWWGLGVAAGTAALVPARLVAVVPPITRDRWPPGVRADTLRDLLALLGCWWVLFAVCVVALLRAPRRASVATALVLGVGAGAASLGHAVLSDDLFRYVWDGRVQAAGIDPYRYPPSAPELAGLRDRWLWPSDEVCRDLDRTVPCTRLNRPGVPTIYPPAAQLWFRIAHVLLPPSGGELPWQLLGLCVSTATAVLIAHVLSRRGGDPRWVALWSCCPLVPVEALQNAHVDAVAALAVVAAAAVALGGGACAGAASRGRATAVGLLVAVAGLVKLFPFALLPALVQRSRPTAWTAAVLLTVAAYAPHVAGVGGGVVGYLRGHLQEQGYRDGGRFLLLSSTGLPAPLLAPAAAALGLVVIGLAVRRRLGPPVPAALTTLAALLLVATPGEPWYELVLLVLVALTGRWEWLGIVVADYVVYLTALLDDPGSAAPQLSYLAALVLGLTVSLLRRRTAARRTAAVARRADGAPPAPGLDRRAGPG